MVEVGDGVAGSAAGAGADASTPIRSEIGPLLIPASRTSHKRAHHPSARVTRTDREYETKPPAAEVASLKSTAPAVAPRASDSHGAESSSGRSDAPAATGAGDDAPPVPASTDVTGHRTLPHI